MIRRRQKGGLLGFKSWRIFALGHGFANTYIFFSMCALYFNMELIFLKYVMTFKKLQFKSQQLMLPKIEK